jgi:glycosyltransferase involved in cell wall biosynthesis
MLRVLHLIPSISPRRGGPSQAVLAMVAALRQQDVDASIVTTNDDGPGVLADLPLKHWHQHQGVPVLAFPRLSPPLRPLREFAFSPDLLRWLVEHLHQYQLLHVHALFSFPSTAAMAVARRQRLPYVLRSIGQLQHWSLQQSAGRKRLMLRLIERRNLEGAAALHFTTPMEQQEAAALNLGVPSFVLPLGVSIPSLADQAPVRQCSIPVQLLFLSRLHPKKQLPLLLEALAALQHRRPDAHWQLHIAGEGDPVYVESLRQLALRLGISPQLHWHGFVAGARKAALFSSADWFVLPSAAENFGIAAAEALAAGVPVLLTPGVALADQVLQADAGVVAQPSVPALCDALERHCLESPSELQRARARQLAMEHYSWNTIAGELALRYSSILASAPSR